MNNTKYWILALAIIVAAALVGRAYTYKYRAQQTIVVTGLGETEFSSDKIVWSAAITAEAPTAAAGYLKIEESKAKVVEFLAAKGVATESVVFGFVNADKQYQPLYNENGNWMGQRFTGYELRQRFEVESTDVALIEQVSREISSLIAKGVAIEAYAPDYYYTKLDDVKMGLIDRLGRCPSACREDRRQCRCRADVGSLGPHGCLPDHGSQHERELLGRRFVQHLLAPKEGPHHDAHRIPRQISKLQKTNINRWKEKFACVLHPAPPARSTLVVCVRPSTTTSLPVSTGAR